MRVSRHVFTEVSLTAVFRWKENGKRRQTSRKFFQTINPFNTKPDGTPKTRSDIMAELEQQRNAWLAEKARELG